MRRVPRAPDRWRLRSRQRRRDRGGIAIEAAIVVPSVVALVLVAIAAGRVQTTAGTVEAAARAGARTASLQRSVDGMKQPARDSALAMLRQQGVSCRNGDVRVDNGQLNLPGGPVTTVTVTVICDVELADLLGGPSGVPVTKHLVGEFTSVVDRYRGT
ncbi:TadE/TadG family type IV pilus assembly protein [Streptomyces sp. CBMA156]|uniref:TadE/TadG family type IV pilus assembly protein n=1 Tax=Streptomyces sp. CBMA156 TaxID=1930280 RepID=UPI001661AC1A|nr:TadE/TadG family type IV pilus assembly protein [Streptomyces sp. CBMA156]